MPVRVIGRFRDLKAYWWFGIIVLLSFVLLGCGTNSTAEEALGESPTPTKDIFGSSTGMKKTEKPDTPPEPVINDRGSTIYLRNSTGTDWISISFISDMTQSTNMPGKFEEIVWNTPRRVKPKTSPTNWDNLSCRTPRKRPRPLCPSRASDVFHIKYSSKLDIMVILDKEVSSWNDLLRSRILDKGTLKDRFGSSQKQHDIGIDSGWYFTVDQPPVTVPPR